MFSWNENLSAGVKALIRASGIEGSHDAMFGDLAKWLSEQTLDKSVGGSDCRRRCRGEEL